MGTIISLGIGFVFGTMFGFILTFVLMSEKEELNNRYNKHEKINKKHKTTKRRSAH